VPQSYQNRQIVRPIILVVLSLLFVGLILFSALKVKYQLDDNPTSEPKITQLSLTDSVIRNEQGKLINPNKSQPGGGADRDACPT